MTPAELIQFILSETGITQVELANKIEYPPSAVSEWKTGKKIPSDRALKIIKNKYKKVLTSIR